MRKSYKKNEEIVSRKISDESILVPIRDNAGDLGFIYNLNDVGTFIWERIDGKRQLMDIRKMLVDEFEVNPPEADRDLLQFIADLEKMSFIIEVDSLS